MKTTIKLFLSFLLLGGSLSCFAQKMPLKEGVNNIPDGRNIVVQPIFNKDDNIKGNITIDFTIDKTGNVISANVDNNGTTITDRVIIHKCELAVKAAKFNTLKTAPDTQQGSLYFSFKGK